MSKSNLSAWERWELTSFDSAEHSSRLRPNSPAEPTPAEEVIEAVKLPTAADIEALLQQTREQGRQEGHAEGYAAGQAAGLEASMGEATKLANAIVQLDTAISTFDEQVSQEILLLALAVAQQVVRISIDQQPEAILTVISESLALLPHQSASIYLHPEDAALVRNQQGTELTHAGHRIHEDSALNRGDCVLESGNSRVDATLATRWRSVVTTFGSDIVQAALEGNREAP